MRRIVRDLSDGALALDKLAGIHHLRSTRGKNSRQANTATIYARVSGQVPSPIPGQPALELDRDILTFRCEQLEDRRWICSTESLRSLLNPLLADRRLFSSGEVAAGHLSPASDHRRYEHPERARLSRRTALDLHRQVTPG